MVVGLGGAWILSCLIFRYEKSCEIGGGEVGTKDKCDQVNESLNGSLR